MDDALNKPDDTRGTSKDTVGARRTARVVILMRALVAGCAVTVSIWAGCPWLGSAGLGLLGAIAIAAELSPLRPSALRWKFGLAIAFGLSLLVPATPLVVADANFSLDEYGPYYQAVLAWLVAVCVVPAGVRAANPGRLRLAAMSCALIGDMLWLAGSWSDNLRGVCYLGLLVTLALLILCKLWFRLPAVAIVAVNTLLLLVFVLGAVDLFVAPPPRLDPDPEAGWKYSYQTARKDAARLDPHLAASRKYYSYETARKDPATFARWWACQAEQWRLMSKDIVVPDRGQAPAWHLRPGAHSRFFDCPISINSLGFRGKENRREKGDAYRIVTLGESTTFGATLGPEDKPWPELLEQMIRERLNARRPVGVINAGVAAYTVEDNLHRLTKDILPLKPDMIISYHGYNGFPMLDQSLLAVFGPAPPVYRPRPLTLVANVEYRLKLYRYRQRRSVRNAPHSKTVPDVMNTDYARAYRELAKITKTNSIRLVLANFSMAVNNQSDPDVIEFYRSGFPQVKRQIEANRLHSALVQQIAGQNPEVRLVDTHPHLDGEHEKFIDLVHLTQEGRQQLAENIFAGIKPVLEKDLDRLDVPAAAP